MRNLHVVLALLLSAAMSLVGCGRSSAGEAQPRQVVLYCSADQEFSQQVVEQFMKKTGIKVLCRYDMEATKTLGLVQRLRSEAANPQADVFWSSEVFETIRLADENVLTAYSSKTTAGWPAAFRDGQGRWYGFALRARALAYSTRHVKKDEAPKSLEDLLDAKWKDQLVMGRPQFGANRGHAAAMWLYYGPAKAQAIFRGLKANGVRLVNGNSTAVRLVAEGQAKIGLVDTDDVWVAQRNGWPVEIVYPRHGTAGTLLIPNTVARVRGGPHESEAAALIDFLLSEEVERFLAASDSHNIPIRPALAKEFSRYAVPSPMAMDYAKVAAVMTPAIRSVSEILGN